MKHFEVINILQENKVTLENICSRFTDTMSDGLLMNIDDGKIYRTLIIEICDLLNDYLGQNKYSSMIGSYYKNGLTGFLGTPNKHSVECVISVINSTITRIQATLIYQQNQKKLSMQLVKNETYHALKN